MKSLSYLRFIGLGTELLLYLALGIGGGYLLDMRYRVLPLWTIVGLVAAMGLGAYVYYVRITRGGRSRGA